MIGECFKWPIFVTASLLTLQLALFPGTAAADDYRVMDWQTDLRTVADEVAKPIHELLSAQPGASWVDYSKLYNERLETIRDRVDPLSYQVLSSALATMNDNFMTDSGELQPGWRDAEAHLDGQIDFAYRIITLLIPDR